MPTESENHDANTPDANTPIGTAAELQDRPAGRTERSATKNSRRSSQSSRREIIATLVLGATAGAAGNAAPAEARQVSRLDAPVPGSETDVPGPGTGLLVQMYNRLFFVPAAWLSHFEITAPQSELGPIEAVTRRMRRKDNRNVQRVMYGNLGDLNLPQPPSRIGKRPIVIAPNPDDTYVSAMIAPNLIDRA